MYARLSMALVGLLASATAAAQRYVPYTTPPWEWMTDLQLHVEAPGDPLWAYARGTIGGASAMGTLGNDLNPIICMPHNITNYELLDLFGSFLVNNELLDQPGGILELVAPLAALEAFPCPQNFGQAL